MAGERKGKTYEAILKVALDRLKGAGSLKGEVFWNKMPKGMTIEPDFTLGMNEDHPTHVLLVTHSGSAKESEKKLWRNLGELAEAKLFLATVPRAYNIAFDTVVKEDLKKIQAAAFDGQLLVGDMKYGDALQAWVDKHHAKLPINAEDKAAELAKLAVKDTTLKGLIGKLVHDLDTTLKKRRPELDQLWAMEKIRKSAGAPKARNTFCRRGLSKLLIFEELDLALRMYRGKKVLINELPDYAFELGLAKKSIGRAMPGDDEVLNAVNLLTDERIRMIVKAAPLDEINGWLVALRNSTHIDAASKYVISQFDELTDPRELAKQLRLLEADPNALVDPANAPSNWPPKNIWLFEFLLELFKAATGTANGYGYAKLALDAQREPGMPGAADPVYRMNLPDWVLRRGRLKLSKSFIEGLSTVIAARIAEIGKAEVVRLARDMKMGVITNILEVKLLTYRMFDPLLNLIGAALESSSVVSLKACFAEAAGLDGAAGKIRVLRSGATIVNWQSVSDAGRDHKKKELCGRAVGLRYSWNSTLRRFTPRAGIKKLVLVVDGTWRQGDLNALVRSGWDEILYPDEMDKLAKAIA